MHILNKVQHEDGLDPYVVNVLSILRNQTFVYLTLRAIHNLGLQCH